MFLLASLRATEPQQQAYKAERTRSMHYDGGDETSLPLKSSLHQSSQDLDQIVWRSCKKGPEQCVIQMTLLFLSESIHHIDDHANKSSILQIFYFYLGLFLLTHVKIVIGFAISNDESSFGVSKTVRRYYFNKQMVGDKHSNLSNDVIRPWTSIFLHVLSCLSVICICGG